MTEKMKLLIFFLAFASFSWSQPNWDYVNFPTSANNWSSKGGAICPTQEVYSLELNAGGTYRIVEYTNGSFSNITSQFPVGTYFEQGYNSIDADQANVYTVSTNLTTKQGLIHYSPQSPGGPAPPPSPQLRGSITPSNTTNAKVLMSSVNVDGIFLYITGALVNITGTNSFTFSNGYPPITIPSSSPYTSHGFVAKFHISSQTWMWVKTFALSNGSSRPTDSDIDVNGDLFVTGYFNTNLTISDGLSLISSHTANALSGIDSYVLKFNSSGTIDPTWSLKQNPITLNIAATDIKADPVTSEIYYISDHHEIKSYSSSLSGTLNWTKTIPNSDLLQLGVNTCGEVLVTGEVKQGFNEVYFARNFDKNTTLDIWTSNTTSNINNSRGTAALIRNDNSVNLLGDFSGNGSTQNMKIDAEPASIHSKGVFVTQASSSCCKPLPITLSNMTISSSAPLPYLDIYPQLGGIPLSQLNIVWKFNGTVIPSANSPVLFLAGPGGSTAVAGTYCVEVTFPNCIDPVVACMDLTITNDPTNCEIEPKIHLEVENCVFKFSNLSIIGAGTTVIGYLWNFGDGTTSNDENPYHAYSHAGIYNVSFTVFGYDSNGNCCSETIVKQVTVEPECEGSDCKIQPNMLINILGNTVVLSDNSFGIGKTTIIGYSWTIDGSPVSTQSDVVLQLPAGNYQVCLIVYAINDLGECCEVQICESIDIEECKDVDMMVVRESKTELDGNSKTPEKGLTIYPNPGTEKVTIEFHNEMKNGSVDLVITDLAGNKILEQKMTSRHAQIDINDWASGLYFCKIIDEDLILTQKIVKN